MSVTRVDSQTVRDLLAGGATYLDVRSLPEFQAGHVPGAYNIPLLHMGPQGMTPNPKFMAEVESAFPREAQLVIACKAGGRSAQAAEMLRARGYTSLHDYIGGYSGGHGDPGWVASGGETTTECEPGRAYEDLRK